MSFRAAAKSLVYNTLLCRESSNFADSPEGKGLIVSIVSAALICAVSDDPEVSELNLKKAGGPVGLPASFCNVRSVAVTRLLEQFEYRHAYIIEVSHKVYT